MNRPLAVPITRALFWTALAGFLLCASGVTRPVAAGDPPPAMPQGYRAVPFGDLTGSPEPSPLTFVRSINGVGQVVGESSNGLAFHGFRWTDLNEDGAWQPGEMVDLGALEPDWYDWSEATGISQGGLVCGNSMVRVTVPDGSGGTIDLTVQRPYRWKDTDSNGQVDPGERIPILPPTVIGNGRASKKIVTTGDVNDAFAVAVNDAGQVVGYCLDRGANPQYHAFMWSDRNHNDAWDDGESIEIGAHPALLGGQSRIPHALSNSGQALVNLFSTFEPFNPDGESLFGDHAVIFQDRNDNGVNDPGETFDLGGLGHTGAERTVGYALNEGGRVAGHAASADGGFQDAMFWRDANGSFASDPGEMMDLDYLFGQGSAALRLNARSDAIGQHIEWGGAQHMTLFKDGQILYLEPLMPGGWQISAFTWSASNQAFGVGRLGLGIDDSGRVLFQGRRVGMDWTNGLLVPDVRAMKLKSITIPESVLPVNSTFEATVTLEEPAPTEGWIEVGCTGAAAATDGVVFDEGFTWKPYLHVPAGATTLKFTLVTSLVYTLQKGEVFASLPNGRVAAPLTVRPVSVGELAVNPGSVIGGGGRTMDGSVTLEWPAIPRSITVALSSTNPRAAAPAVSSLTFPSGTQGPQTFTINTGYVSAPTNVTLKASANGHSKSVVVHVDPIAPASLTAAASSVTGTAANPAETTGKVTLNTAAEVEDALVALASSDPSVAAVPPTVTVPLGSASADFPIDAKAVRVSTGVTLTATLNGVTRKVNLTVHPIRPASVTVNPAVVVGNPDVGGESLGTVTLDAPADPGGLLVTLASLNAAASVPPSVLVPEGSSTATFAIDAKRVTTTTGVAIVARTNGIGKSARLTVKPYLVASLTLSPNRVRGGGSVGAQVLLNAPAPAGGLDVLLSSENPAVARPHVAKVHINAGSTGSDGSGAFTVDSFPVTSKLAVYISAALNGTVKKPIIVTP
jgi:probable HAF family extracellular repeat protein